MIGTIPLEQAASARQQRVGEVDGTVLEQETNSGEGAGWRAGSDCSSRHFVLAVYGGIQCRVNPFHISNHCVEQLTGADLAPADEGREASCNKARVLTEKHPPLSQQSRCC
jgi:hypothetical protein